MEDGARMQILQAVEDGQISAVEAARLLDALSGRAAGSEPSVRVRVIETDTERLRIDLVLPLSMLEMFAQVGLRPDALWGLSGEMDAAAIVAAVRSGRRGVLAEATDEAKGTRVELSVDEG
jgi:hypothetical protein